MKNKSLLTIPILCLSFIFVPTASNVAYAEEETSDAEETVQNVLDGIDLDGYEELLVLLKDEYNLDFTDTVKKIISDLLQDRSDVDASYFFTLVTSLLIGNVSGYVAQLGIILLICLLLSLLKNLTVGFSSKTIEKIVYLACYSVIVTIVLSLSSTAINDVSKYIETIKLFTEVIFPPLLTVMTAIGSISASTLYQPSLLLFSTTILSVLNKIILPLFYLSFILTVVGHINDELKLKKLVKTARSVSEWTLSVFFGIFTMITTAKGIVGTGMDSFSVRSAKFALSGYVPIVGGYLKEGFDIVVASCIIVKNAVGVTAVLLLLLTVLCPIIKVALTIFTLRFAASIAEPIGLDNVSSMLYDVSDCLKMLVVLILCTAFSLFILLLLIILSFNGGLL